MTEPRPQVCSHTWRVGRCEVTLTLDRRPGAPPPSNVWRPRQPLLFTPRMHAEYEAGLHAAIAKFRAAFGEPPSPTVAGEPQ